ncbi:uncharacterized protein LOC144209934 [Stigmatopora nigra]
MPEERAPSEPEDHILEWESALPRQKDIPRETTSSLMREDKASVTVWMRHSPDVQGKMESVGWPTGTETTPGHGAQNQTRRADRWSPEQERSEKSPEAEEKLPTPQMGTWQWSTLEETSPPEFDPLSPQETPQNRTFQPEDLTSFWEEGTELISAPFRESTRTAVVEKTARAATLSTHLSALSEAFLLPVKVENDTEVSQDSMTRVELSTGGHREQSPGAQRAYCEEKREAWRLSDCWPVTPLTRDVRPLPKSDPEATQCTEPGERAVRELTGPEPNASSPSFRQSPKRAAEDIPQGTGEPVFLQMEARPQTESRGKAPAKSPTQGFAPRDRHQGSLDAEHRACQEKLLALRIKKWQQGTQRSREGTSPSEEMDGEEHIGEPEGATTPPLRQSPRMEARESQIETRVSMSQVADSPESGSGSLALPRGQKSPRDNLKTTTGAGDERFLFEQSSQERELQLSMENLSELKKGQRFVSEEEALARRIIQWQRDVLMERQDATQPESQWTLSQVSAHEFQRTRGEAEDGRETSGTTAAGEFLPKKLQDPEDGQTGLGTNIGYFVSQEEEEEEVDLFRHQLDVATPEPSWAFVPSADLSQIHHQTSQEGAPLQPSPPLDPDSPLTAAAAQDAAHVVDQSYWRCRSTVSPPGSDGLQTLVASRVPLMSPSEPNREEGGPFANGTETAKVESGKSASEEMGEDWPAIGDQSGSTTQERQTQMEILGPDQTVPGLQTASGQAAHAEPGTQSIKELSSPPVGRSQAPLENQWGGLAETDFLSRDGMAPEVVAHKVAAHEVAAHKVAAHKVAAHEVAAHEVAAHEVAAHEVSTPEVGTSPNADAGPTLSKETTLPVRLGEADPNDSSEDQTKTESEKQIISKDITRPSLTSAVPKGAATVDGRPVFSKEISSLRVSLGEMTQLTCRYRGHPPPRLTWLKDGRGLADDPDYHVSLESGRSTLTLFYPTTDHEGTYHCLLSNKHGECVSSATLTLSNGDHIESGQREGEARVERPAGPAPVSRVPFAEIPADLATEEGSRVTGDAAAVEKGQKEPVPGGLAEAPPVTGCGLQQSAAAIHVSLIKRAFERDSATASSRKPPEEPPSPAVASPRALKHGGDVHAEPSAATGSPRPTPTLPPESPEPAPLTRKVSQSGETVAGLEEAAPRLAADAAPRESPPLPPIETTAGQGEEKKAHLFDRSASFVPFQSDVSSARVRVQTSVSSSPAEKPQRLAEALQSDKQKASSPGSQGVAEAQSAAVEERTVDTVNEWKAGHAASTDSESPSPPEASWDGHVSFGDSVRRQSVADDSPKREAAAPEESAKVEEEAVTFGAVYEYYNPPAAADWHRPLSPESEMSIEVGGQEVAESFRSANSPSDPTCPWAKSPDSPDSFHTPLSPSSFQTAHSVGSFEPPDSPASFHTPISDTEVYPSSPAQEIPSPTPSSGDRFFSPDRSPTPPAEREEEGRFPAESAIPPAFLKPLSGQRLAERDTLLFAAEVFGLPPPQVEWFRDKSRLVPDQRTLLERRGDAVSLVVRDVGKSDQGEYVCRAANRVGEARSVALVTVVSREASGSAAPAPPAVTHQHVMEFDMEEAERDGDSSRSPSPQEILMEVELDEEDVKDFERRVKIIAIPEYTADGKSMVVSLDVVPAAHEEGAVDFVTREHAQLKIALEVTETPPRFVRPVGDAETRPGSDVTLECRLEGTPSPVVSWFREDKSIPHRDARFLRWSRGDRHFLTICQVTAGDAGVYACAAVNVAGETLCRGRLAVAGPEDGGGELTAVSLGAAQSRPREFDLLLRDPAAEDVPPSEVELEFEFSPEGDESHRGVRLVAQARRGSASDRYAGVDLDVFDSSSAEDEVTFQGESSDLCAFAFRLTETPPRLLIPLTDVSAPLGAPVVLRCQVSGGPELGPVAEWYKDGRRLAGGGEEDGDGHFNLPIGKVERRHAGEYRCLIRNAAGWIQTSALLRVS